MKPIKTKWTERDGTKIRICDMDDHHIVCTLKMLIRQAERHRIIDLRHAELIDRTVTADEASYCADRNLEAAMKATWEDCVHDLYEPMHEDFMRRQLPMLPSFAQIIRNDPEETSERNERAAEQQLGIGKAWFHHPN